MFKLAAAGLLLLLGASVVSWWLFGQGAAPGQAISETTQGSDGEQERLKALIREGQPPQTPDPEAETLALIAEYENRLKNEPQSSEVPAILAALGNLYSHKLMDCRRASEYYEEIILNHADWEGARVIYPELSVCYERLGDQEQLQWLYRRMMEVFPEDTQEYAFARAQLNL